MGQNQSRPNDGQPAAGDERQEDSDDEVVGSAAPMDQGRFGTCCGYAFTRCLVENIANKYQVHLERNEVLGLIKGLCPCWNGHKPKAMAEEFNKNVADNEKIFFADIGQKRRYRVKVGEIRTIECFDECWDTVRKWQGVLRLVGSIQTRTDGHGRHAVMLDHSLAPERGKKLMRSQNSWGSKEAVIYVKKEGDGKFIRALFINPEIIEVREPGNCKGQIPKPSKEYEQCRMGKTMDPCPEIARVQATGTGKKRSRSDYDDGGAAAGRSPSSSPYDRQKNAAAIARERIEKRQKMSEDNGFDDGLSTEERWELIDEIDRGAGGKMT